VIRVAVDTASPRRLDDGSWLVWFRFDHEKPLPRAGTLFDRQNSQFILRCETPTDGRYKDVSTTRFLGAGPPVFQDRLAPGAAMNQPWKRAWGGSLDLAIFQGACRQVLRRP
jgi:hypothetical protein